MKANVSGDLRHGILRSKPFQDAAGLVLGGMVLVRSAANIAGQLSRWHPRGWGGGFLAHLHSPWDYDELEIFVTQIENLVP